MRACVRACVTSLIFFNLIVTYHCPVSSTENMFPRFWALINVAITNATKNASQVPRVRAEEEGNGRRDEIENGGQEPEERRVTREEDNGWRCEKMDDKSPKKEELHEKTIVDEETREKTDRVLKTEEQ